MEEVHRVIAGGGTTLDLQGNKIGAEGCARARGGRRRGAETAAAPEPEQDEPRVHSSGDFGFGGGGTSSKGSIIVDPMNPQRPPQTRQKLPRRSVRDFYSVTV